MVWIDENTEETPIKRKLTLDQTQCEHKHKNVCRKMNENETRRKNKTQS